MDRYYVHVVTYTKPKELGYYQVYEDVYKYEDYNGCESEDDAIQKAKIEHKKKDYNDVKYVIYNVSLIQVVTDFYDIDSLYRLHGKEYVVQASEASSLFNVEKNEQGVIELTKVAESEVQFAYCGEDEILAYKDVKILYKNNHLDWLSENFENIIEKL